MGETSVAVILVQNISKKLQNADKLQNKADACVGDDKQAVPLIHTVYHHPEFPHKCISK